MKLRDTLNTFEGYQEIIYKSSNYVKEDFEDLKGYNSSEDKKKILDTYYSIYKYSFKIFNANYSLGKITLKLKEPYVSLIEPLIKYWNAESGYVQIVNMLSIGILLDIEDTEFDKLVALVERDKLKDYVIDFLIRYRKPHWHQTEKFLWAKPYKIIKDIVTVSENDKQKAIELLKKYLKAWYKDLEVKTHESKWNIHTGYWSWEAGAIAKILELDDSSLKDQPYYPYDMVHFKDD